MELNAIDPALNEPADNVPFIARLFIILKDASPIDTSPITMRRLFKDTSVIQVYGCTIVVVPLTDMFPVPMLNLCEESRTVTFPPLISKNPSIYVAFN